MLKFIILPALVLLPVSCSDPDLSEVAAVNRPKGFKTICRIDETCELSSESLVAFGASGRFVYKTLQGTFVCSVETFGSDPMPSKKVKECSRSLEHKPGLIEPLELKAIAVSGKIQLTWKAQASIKKLHILRDVDLDPAGGLLIETPSLQDSSYLDAKVEAGALYYYWLQYQTSTGGSVRTDPVSISLSVGLPDPGSTDDCRAGATIRNKVVDCGGKTIGLSCNADSESQPPVLTLINSTVKNVRIAAGGGSDGIHCIKGDCTLENVVWEDICEDAATHKSDGGTLRIIGGSVYNDAPGPGGKPDKIFQHNSKNSTTIITGGFTIKGENGKLWRSCGDCSNNGGPRQVIIDGVVIEGKISASVVGPNQNFGDKATIRNLKIRNYKPGSPKICDEFLGVAKGQGESKKLGEFWKTGSCDVSPSDIFGF